MVDRASFPLNPPLSRGALHQLRLDLRRRVPAIGLGSHLHRRMGQSLEFREYRDYSYGDDIRLVDWAASARRGEGSQLIVRSFEAEVQRTLVVLLDCRPAMLLPEAVPKLGVALWVTLCLVEAALAERDQVIVVPVFTNKRWGPIRIRGPRGMVELQEHVKRFLHSSPTPEDWVGEPNSPITDPALILKPAAAVVLVSDALFGNPSHDFLNFAIKAQSSFRTFHVVEIDSWPQERALLAQEPFQLLPMAGKDFGDQVSEAPDQFLRAADNALAKHRERNRQQISGPGLIWPELPLRYPEYPEFGVTAAQAWFPDAFAQAQFLPGLMSRVS